MCPEPIRPRPTATGRQRTAGIARAVAGTAVVEQLARAASTVGPRRLASGAASLLRHGVHYTGQLASKSLAARRFNPKKATGASPIPLSPTTPSTTATCRPISRCAPSGPPRQPKPTCVETQRAAAVFCQRGAVIIAGAYQCAARQSSRAQTRLRKQRCEPDAGPAQLPALTCASTGDARSGQAVALCVSARTSRSLRARLPRRCVRGDSVGGAILRSSSPCSRA
jgi:hypothetical protein